jgi:murein DD-endopeptidase MepM/ murein hydrolase activator NlpD
MRHPVDVVRITSKFNPKRLHPVLHQIRAHRGVDYGSPYGSPIYATGDGRVIHSGNKSAYGKTVILKHGEKYSTLYAHMSRISDKSTVGKRVKQGDVIGYVGNTGRVTGTHLHYEFRVNGMQIDPLKVELPVAAPLAEEYLDRLSALSQEMMLLMSNSREEMNLDIKLANVPDWQEAVLLPTE